MLAAQIAEHAATMPLPVGNEGPGSVEDTELTLLTDLLAEPTVSPAQWAAAFTTLSQRSEVGLLGQHADPLGRTGTAVEYEVHNGATWRITLTFDPDNAVLLASESTLTKRGDQQWLAAVPLGVWDWTATTASAPVTAIGDTDGLQRAPEPTAG